MIKKIQNNKITCSTQINNLHFKLRTYKNEVLVINCLSYELVTIGQLNNNIYKLKVNLLLSSHVYYLNLNICVILVIICVCIDYCNSLLYGLPDYCLNRLQKIMNSPMHIFDKLAKFDITEVIMDFHCLPVRQRSLNFKLLCIF